tara:strand:- start:199 stop:921 length:723 start_codon:yes stop_codon:yes gene_type:complete
MSHSSRPGYGGSSTNKKGVNTSKYTPKMYAPKPRNTGVNSNDNSNDDREKTIKELDSLISRPKPKPPEETTTPKIKPKPKPPKEETIPKTKFKIKPKPKPKDEKDYSIVEKDYRYDKRFSRAPSKEESTSRGVINPKLNSGLMSEFNIETLPEVILNSSTKDTTPSQLEEIQFQIADSINSIAKDNLSPSAYTILATSTAIADITLFKKEFRVNLNDHANITAKWKDGVSLMYNLKLGVN